MMFDRKLTSRIERQIASSDTQAVLELTSVSTIGEGTEVSLKRLDLQVFPGEIVGIAGVSGNGQKELCDAILGIKKIHSGTKSIDGIDFTRKSNGSMRRFGVGFIPEDPLAMATVPFMSVLENMAITRPGAYSTHGGLGMNWKLVQEDTKEALAKFGFTFSYYLPAKSLSGGNLQRLIIAREMMKKPRLIVASYLTRGLDVQGTLVARQELMNARNAGTGVLLISEDLEELFSLSDRLLVLYDGCIVGQFRPAETDIYAIGHLNDRIKGSLWHKELILCQ